MRYAFRYTLLTGLCLGALTGIGAAHAAANSSIVNALNSRPELSQFNNALQATGVLNELNPNMQYTIFAPTNDAFARMTQMEYPCLYSQQCREDIAAILRNHIVPGPVYLSDSAYMKGGVYSIDRRFVSLGQPNHDYFTVDGHQVLSQSQLLGGVLYEINGVVANPQEMASLRQLRYVPVVADTATQHTVTQNTYYAPSGRPDGMGETTSVTRTTTYDPAVVVAPGVVYEPVR